MRRTGVVGRRLAVALVLALAALNLAGPDRSIRWAPPGLWHAAGPVVVHATYFPTEVRSRQRATIALGVGVTSNTATISSVTLANAAIRYLGVNRGSINGGVDTDQLVRVTLTNATTVTATRASSVDAASVSFEVDEYFPWSLLSNTQCGTISNVTASLTATQTITSVNTGKAQLEFTGEDSNSGDTGKDMYLLALTNSTTITATRIVSQAITSNIGYCVVEKR